MTNNVAEQYNSLIAKFIGGKRVNYSMKGSYKMRCEAAAITYNLKGEYYESIYKSIASVSPGKHTKNFVAKKEKRRIYNKAYQKPKYKNVKKVLPIENTDYGEHASEIPDMVPEIFEKMKDHLLTELKVTEEETNKIERETIGQVNNKKWISHRAKRLTASWFGKICKQKKKISCANLI